jgi:hypothetical protein
VGGDGLVAIPYILVIEGVKMVDAPPGEVAPTAHPMGLMRACKWAVPIAFEHLVAMEVVQWMCIASQRSGGQGWHSS